MAQSRQPRELDNLPAFGLREDAFDDELRAATRNRSRRPRYPEDEDDDEDDEWSPRPHLVEDPADPAVWLARERVSQTEVSLQLGRHLLQSSLAMSNVVVTLAGYELTVQGRPHFPVARYLTERLGFEPRANRRNRWNGHYSMPGVRHKLAVTFDRLNGHVTARLPAGERLVVFVSGGRAHSARGSAERRMIYATIGRAVTWGGAKPDDRVAICVPRSPAFRKALVEFRKALWVRQLGIDLLTVERASGSVGGLD